MNVPDAFCRLIDAIKKHHPDFPLPEKIDGVSPSSLKSIRASMPSAPEQLFELFEHFDFECVNLFSPLCLLAPAVMQDRVAAQIEFYADVDSMYCDCALPSQPWISMASGPSSLAAE